MSASSFFIRRALLVFCLLAPTLPGHAQTRQDSNVAVFDDVWTSVRDYYYDPDFNQSRWDALGRELRPAAAGAPTSRELYAVLRRLLRHLRDSHTRVYAPD